MPPQKPKPWTDVFPALWWGNSAPQNMDNRYANKYASFRDRWNYDDVSEDCLKLNVFTPAINDGKKRPVLFWIHGGGFTNGNAIEQDGYHGENFARFGDVVFVSINHRLGPLGFTNLAGAGRSEVRRFGQRRHARHRRGPGVGARQHHELRRRPRQRDHHGAVRRRREGDHALRDARGQGALPQGGRPQRRGHRSGDKEYSEKLGSYVLKEAGLTPADIGKLQAMPWKDYLTLANKAQQNLAAETGPGGGGLRRGYNPVVDGTVLPQHPFLPGRPPTAAKVPMLVCSTFHEQSMSWADSKLEAITLDQIAGRVKERAGFGPGFGDKAQAVVDAYAKAFPGKKPIEILSLVTSSRQGVVELANAKSKQPAPVFVAWFGWQPPMFDGRLRAFHCIDISFWFHNTDLMWSHTGGGARPRRLSEKMAGHLLAFMKTGEPNAQGAHAVAEVHPGERRNADPRRRLRGEERSGPRSAEGSADDVRARGLPPSLKLRRTSGAG